MTDFEIVSKKIIKNSKKVKKEINYSIQEIRCCDNCNNKNVGYENEINCIHIPDGNYSFTESEVDRMGICDKWEKYK
jgi:hypothetical protein